MDERWCEVVKAVMRVLREGVSSVMSVEECIQGRKEGRKKGRKEGGKEGRKEGRGWFNEIVIC